MFKKTVVLVCFTLFASMSANAHVIGFGAVDLGDGNVRVYAEQWHGDLGSPTGALVIDGFGTFAFTGVLNNTAPAALSFDTVFGYSIDPQGSYQDWLVVDVAGLTSGLYTFNTDNADAFVSCFGCSTRAYLEVSNVPEPGTLALLGFGFVVAGVARRRAIRR